MLIVSDKSLSSFFPQSNPESKPLFSLFFFFFLDGAFLGEHIKQPPFAGGETDWLENEEEDDEDTDFLLPFFSIFIPFSSKGEKGLPPASVPGFSGSAGRERSKLFDDKGAGGLGASGGGRDLRRLKRVSRWEGRPAPVNPAQLIAATCSSTVESMACESSSSTAFSPSLSEKKSSIFFFP
ncbi:LRR and NB-ARC domains-containing diseaseresistance protein [Striga asiatica]|uniref:LRR and NB-ARC domains-containing diseaseresistance protein n=1 Tax=Striga asiatica TaxID=4170 RepID=A0A5A7P5W3_STRAF|nr:LRR and NB-ARC domains-containing diseaseresistance protein [Striga asiatica]